MPTDENALAVRNMKFFDIKEIERRKAKEKLKEHLGSNYHKYKKGVQHEDFPGGHPS